MTNVLFLCTGNSCRSVMAEAALNRRGAGSYRAYSAGSRPSGAVHPTTVELLDELGYPTAGLRSKSWDEFSAPDAPVMDVVVTVCDAAAGETCPLWPGSPRAAHWGFPDPAAFRGDDGARRAYFREIFDTIDARIRVFVETGEL